MKQNKVSMWNILVYQPLEAEVKKEWGWPCSTMKDFLLNMLKDLGCALSTEQKEWGGQ